MTNEKRIADLTPEEIKERFGDINQPTKIHVEHNDRSFRVDKESLAAHPRLAYYIAFLRERKKQQEKAD